MAAVSIAGTTRRSGRTCGRRSWRRQTSHRRHSRGKVVREDELTKETDLKVKE